MSGIAGPVSRGAPEAGVPAPAGGGEPGGLPHEHTASRRHTMGDDTTGGIGRRRLMEASAGSVALAALPGAAHPAVPAPRGGGAGRLEADDPDERV